MLGINHDAERWGAAYTDEETPRELVRVAELVKRRIDAQTPLRTAATEVIKALEADGLATWFRLERGCRAVALSPGDAWRPAGRLPGTGDLVVLTPSWHVVHAGNEWLQFDLKGESKGIAGLIRCLRDTWTTDLSRSRQDLDSDQLANEVAILCNDAQRIFGSGVPVSASSVQCCKKLGERWTAEHRSELLRQHEALVAGGNAVKKADAEIASAWNISESNVKQQRLKARAEAKDNAPAARVVA